MRGIRQNCNFGIATCEKPQLCSDLHTAAHNERWVFRCALKSSEKIPSSRTRRSVGGALPVVLWIALAVVAVFLTSCSGNSKELAAKVNGTAITLEKLNASVESAKEQYEAQGRTISDADSASFRSETLENLIANVLLLAYAEDRDYAVDDESIDTEMAGIEAQFASRDDYLSALKERGFSEKSLREEITIGMTIKSMLDAEIGSKITVTDDAVKEFYAGNPDYFEKPESVTASHIIIMVGPEESDEAKRKALEKIKAIRQEIVDGADFAEVAREKSDGPSAPDGGSLGNFTRGQMVPPFEEAAFALEPGELSGIVLTDFGYHIILVDEKIAGGRQPFDEVSDQIRQYLTSVTEQEDTKKLITGLKEKAKIEYFE